LIRNANQAIKLVINLLAALNTIVAAIQELASVRLVQDGMFVEMCLEDRISPAAL